MLKPQVSNRLVLQRFPNNAALFGKSSAEERAAPLPQHLTGAATSRVGVMRMWQEEVMDAYPL
eukprot:1835892-Amphidinium_carterae.1